MKKCPVCLTQDAHPLYAIRWRGTPGTPCCEDCWVRTTISPYQRPRHIHRRRTEAEVAEEVAQVADERDARSDAVLAARQRGRERRARMEKARMAYSAACRQSLGTVMDLGAAMQRLPGQGVAG